MEPISVNTLLFAGKWALIGLVYLILIIIAITVRREMIYQTVGQERPTPVAAGRLKVIDLGAIGAFYPVKFYC